MESNGWIEVKPIHCHKRLPENTLVAGVRAASEDKVLTDVMHKFDPGTLGFFFDHPIDHLPGMFLTCAMRQACLAVTHLIYEVPTDFIIILEWMNMRLLNYGELDKELITRGRLIRLTRKPDRATVVIEGLMVQEDSVIYKAKGKMIALHPAKAAKIRNRKIVYGNGELEVPDGEAVDRRNSSPH